MGVRIYIGGTPCPVCGAMLAYSGHTDIEIYEAKCLRCDRVWHIVKYPDGRTEVRKKEES